MSWKIQALVSERVIGSVLRKAVLFALAGRADDDGNVDIPAPYELSKWCEADAAEVAGALAVLRQTGLIDSFTGVRARISIEALEALPKWGEQ